MPRKTGGWVKVKAKPRRTKAAGPAAPIPEPIGPVLAANLMRLGYVETKVKTSEVARLVAEHTGRPMSRQRISELLNAVRIRPETIATIAAALRVKMSELTTPANPSRRATR